MILSQGEIRSYLQQKIEPDHIYLLGLGLDPRIHGQGIGRLVTATLQAEAVERGLPLGLSVFRTNPRTLMFYESLGFRVTEVTAEFHRLVWQRP